MKNYSYIISLSDELISAVNARDALTMQQKMDELEAAYKKEFGNRLDCFEAFYAFVKMQLAAMRYFAYNNMFEYVHSRYKEAEEAGNSYDPLKDDELFLRQKDFDLYFQDLARMSKNNEYHDKVPKFPFYAEARKAI